MTKGAWPGRGETLERAASKRQDALLSHGATGRTLFPFGVEVFIAPAVYRYVYTLRQKIQKFRWNKLSTKMHAAPAFEPLKGADTMVEIPLDRSSEMQMPATQPALGRLVMLTSLPSAVSMLTIPKLLPMLYSLFCLQIHARKGAAAPGSDVDVESAAAGPAHAVAPSHFSPHVFLVPRLPASTVVVPRPAHKRTADRLIHWFKYSVLRMRG